MQADKTIDLNKLLDKRSRSVDFQNHFKRLGLDDYNAATVICPQTDIQTAKREGRQTHGLTWQIALAAVEEVEFGWQIEVFDCKTSFSGVELFAQHAGARLLDQLE